MKYYSWVFAGGCVCAAVLFVRRVCDCVRVKVSGGRSRRRKRIFALHIITLLFHRRRRRRRLSAVDFVANTVRPHRVHTITLHTHTHPHTVYK